MSRRNRGGGGGSSGPAPQRPAVDANHTNVWYMAAGCSPNGTDILPDIGSVTLSRNSGSGTIATGYSLFSSQQSAYATEATLTGFTGFGGTLSPTIATNQAFSLEVIVLFPSESIATVGYLGSVGVFNGLVDYAQILWRESTTLPGFLTLQNPAGGYLITGVFGAASDQVLFGVPTHLMLTWQPTGASTGTQTFYINGRLLATNTAATAGNRSAAMTAVDVKFIAGSSLADIRISNIARPQSYAIAATRAMRAL